MKADLKFHASTATARAPPMLDNWLSNHPGFWVKPPCSMASIHLSMSLVPFSPCLTASARRISGLLITPRISRASSA